MAQVPMRMAQPGLVPPHQQRTPMMVSMTQPPPVSMQGLVSMAPMMGPAGGMAVMTQAQAMSHPDTVGDHLNTQYHHPNPNPHPHHPHPHPHPHAHPHGPPRPPPGPPPQHHPNPTAGPPPPSAAPQHSQYHHTGHHHHHTGPHMTSNSSAGPHNSHNGPTHMTHMNNPHHSAPPHQMNAMNGGSMGTTHHHHQQQAPQQHHPSQQQQQQAPPPQQHHHPGQQHNQSMHQHQMSQNIQQQQHHHQQQPPSHMPHMHHQQHHQQQQPPPPPQMHQQTHHQSHHQQQATSAPQSHHQQTHQPMHSQSMSAPPPPQQQQHHHHQLHDGMVHSTGSGNVVNIPPNVGNVQMIPTGAGNSTNNIPNNNTNNMTMPQQQQSITSTTPTAPLSQQPNIPSNAQQMAPPPSSTVSDSGGVLLPNNVLDPNDPSGSKEKTPMCLVNELARFNKINHQYCLTDEKGPAHKKTFTVTLRLGDTENYSACGASIKKAQHSAAAIALEKTQFRHPPPKPHKVKGNYKLTPTVELNALAMKRGEVAIYTFVENARAPNPYNFNVPTNLRNMYNQKFYGRPPMYPVFLVTLRVGSKEFTGEGATAQQAKHNAASKALKTIKALPMPDSVPATQPTESNYNLADLDPNAELKSPISLVHEIALKRSLTVEFDVIKESGPPHMRTFVTVCTVGDIRTEGDGTGKKVSKKRAAELMLEELRKLPPLPTCTVPRVKKKPATKKKSRNLIKVGQEEQKAAPEYGQGINPISRLIQIQQAKKEKEPIYTLIAERGVPRRREFVMQVVVGNESAQGTGPNKKLAKRAAAENMLQLLGYSRPQPQPGKPAIKSENSQHSDPDKTRKVTFMEDSTSNDNSSQQHIASSCVATSECSISVPAGGSGRQLVPGLIMMPDGSALHGYQSVQSNTGVGVVNCIPPGVNMQDTAAIAKELLKSGNSPTAEALVKQKSGSQTTQGPQSVNNTTPAKNGPTSNIQVNSQHQGLSSTEHHQPPPTTPSISHSSMNNMTTSQAVVRPKDQLMYLAQILGLQVSFTDFPKGNKSEYLSLVSLSTSPPCVSHGAGPTTDASHDQACLNALQALSKMGLDTVTSNVKDEYGQKN